MNSVKPCKEESKALMNMRSKSDPRGILRVASPQYEGGQKRDARNRYHSTSNIPAFGRKVPLVLLFRAILEIFPAVPKFTDRISLASSIKGKKYIVKKLLISFKMEKNFFRTSLQGRNVHRRTRHTTVSL